MIGSREFDLVIVGGGCIGAAIAYELSRRNFRNIAVVDHGRLSVSATSHSAGMLRVFHENPVHLNLALNNFLALKREFKSGVLTEPVTANGSLYFFNRRRYQSFQPNLAAMDKAGYDFEVMTSVQGRSRFPQFEWKSDDWAVFEPGAGQLSPKDFTDDLLFEAERRGAMILDNFEVNRISYFSAKYHLLSATSTVTSRRLVLAGGARILPRLADLGIDLQLDSRHLEAYVAEKSDAKFVLPNYLDRETLEFGRLGPGADVVVSHLQPRRLLVTSTERGFKRVSVADCYAPDRLGVAGQLPGYSNLFLASGWGGTAFKFALEVGSQIADAVERLSRLGVERNLTNGYP